MTAPDKNVILHANASDFTPQEHDEGCSQPPPESGYGLAGGGYGPYTYCPECGAILWKDNDDG